MSRFSQAISEGDGISVVPVLAGDVAALARAAATAGAEAVAVRSVEEVERAGGQVALPVLLREPIQDSGRLHRAREAGVDACTLVLERLAEEGELLEELHAEALALGFACALDVRDEEELALALERVDPDILIISEREPEKGEEELERTLDLLSDVPAGKLVISDTRVVAREQVLALERAGVDAVIVDDLARSPDFSAALEELVGGPRPGL